MKSFREYLQEAELMEDTPSTGDVFEIEIAREELVLETTVVDVLEDGIVIEADETMMSILRHVGYLAEDSNMPPAQDSTSPINGQKDVYKDFKFQHSEDNDLEEQQGISQRAQDAFKDLDANVTGSQPAQASDLDKFRQRARSGPATPRREVPSVGQYEMDKKFGNVPAGTSYDDWQKLQSKPTNEAKYQGREVPLGKPMKGDVAKSKVYVRDPKTGNVKKVNFGDPNMKIKKSNPARRKSFRARHNCDNPGPRTKARYWSCRAW
jgi:hypothetical protein